MNDFLRAQPRALVRRALTIAAVAAGFILAWAATGFAGGPPPPYYVDADGVIRTAGKQPNPTPSPTPTRRPYGTSTTAKTVKTVKTEQHDYSISRSKDRKVFTITRDGTPWVIVTQRANGVVIHDPSAPDATILDIAGGK